MSKQVIFSLLAKQELDAAVLYYDLEQQGLGERFKTEVRTAIDRIRTYPDAWTMIRPDIRKCILHKFPYSVLYALEGEQILIIAIAHHHRKPEYWSA